MSFKDQLPREYEGRDISKLTEAALQLLGERGRTPSPESSRPRSRSRSRAQLLPGGSNDSVNTLVDTPSPAGPAHEDRNRSSHPRLWHTVKTGGISILMRSLDFSEMPWLTPDGTMLDPDLLLRGIGPDKADSEYHKWVAVKEVMEDMADCADERVMAEDAVERYLVSLGKFMIDCVSGPHFTCIDFGLRNDRHKMIEQALRVIRRFEQKGVEPQQMIVTIPALEEGIAAAQVLEKEHSIKTNLTLVSSVTHAAICAEAGASFITFSDKELIRAYNSIGTGGRDRYPEPWHPAWTAIRSTAAYFEHHRIKTKVIVEISEIDGVAYLEGIGGVCVDERLGYRMKTRAMQLLPRFTANSPEMLTDLALYPAPAMSAENVSFRMMSARGISLVEATAAAVCRNHDECWRWLVQLLAGEIKEKRTPLDELYAEYWEDIEEDIRLAWGGTPSPDLKPRTQDPGFRWLVGRVLHRYPPAGWRPSTRHGSRASASDYF